jgi:peroxiredoxin
MASPTPALPVPAPRDRIIAPGEIAPDFELQTQARQPWRLSEQLKEGEVVLCFFPLAFTGVCATENRCISDEVAKWSAKGASVVALSCDSTAALAAWGQREGYTHTMLSDMHRHVVKGYGLYWPELNVAWRGTVVIGRDGRVKWSQKREIPQAMKLDELLAAM